MKAVFRRVGYVAAVSGSTSPGSDPVITQSGATLSGDASETYNVTGNSLSENIGVGNASPIFISGSGDSLNLAASTSSFAITDEGQGTVFNLAGFASTAGNAIAINDFQLDPTGSIVLPSLYASAASAVAALQPNGQGGSILSLGNGASLHFIDDASLAAANFRVANA